MDRDNPNSNSDPRNDDSLDQLLRQARWPEPEPERIERLWKVWPVRRILPVRSIWPKIAAAAAILFVALTAGSMWRWRSRPVEVVQHTPDIVEESPEELRSPEPLVGTRPANAYEQVIVFAAERMSQAKSHSTATVEHPGLLHKTIEQLATDSEANLTDLADEIGRAHV